MGSAPRPGLPELPGTYRVSLRRQNPWMLQNISARTLFQAGLLTLPAFLLQRELGPRAVQVTFFMVLAVVAGKRLQWAYFTTVVVMVTLFHVLLPAGTVLFSVGPVPVTTGALRTGLFKGLTLLGMVFISLVAVRADLRLPGRIGSLVGKTFWSFEQIMEHRGELDPRHVFVTGDALLLRLYDDLRRMDERHGDTAEQKGTAGRTTALGHVVVWLIVITQWLALLL